MDTLNNNWCIKLDAENRDVVIQYLNNKYNEKLHGDSGYYGVYNKQFNCDDYIFGTEICQPSKIDPNLLPFKVRVTNLYEIEIVRI